MREFQITVCARRRSCKRAFGQGFDSPHLHFFTAIPKRGRGTFFCFGEKSAANQLPISDVLCYNGSEPLRGWCWMCRAAIAPVTLADTAADGNPEWQNTDAEPAETHVFLLSYAQVMQYLPEQEQRKVSGTEYARSRGRSFWASPLSASAKRTGGCARRARKATTRAFWMSAARSERSA